MRSVITKKYADSLIDDVDYLTPTFVILLLFWTFFGWWLFCDASFLPSFNFLLLCFLTSAVENNFFLGYVYRVWLFFYLVFLLFDTVWILLKFSKQTRIMRDVFIGDYLDSLYQKRLSLFFIFTLFVGLIFAFNVAELILSIAFIAGVSDLFFTVPQFKLLVKSTKPAFAK